VKMDRPTKYGLGSRNRTGAPAQLTLAIHFASLLRSLTHRPEQASSIRLFVAFAGQLLHYANVDDKGETSGMALPQTELTKRLRTALHAMNVKSAFRYAIVGLLQNGISYSLLLFLILLGWQAWQAVLVLSPIAMVFSFFANRTWTFGSSDKKPGQFKKYMITCALSYLGSVCFTWVQEAIGIPSWAAALTTTGVVAVAVYLVLNSLIFPSRQPNMSRSL